MEAGPIGENVKEDQVMSSCEITVTENAFSEKTEGSIPVQEKKDELSISQTDESPISSREDDNRRDASESICTTETNSHDDTCRISNAVGSETDNEKIQTGKTTREQGDGSLIVPSYSTSTWESDRPTCTAVTITSCDSLNETIVELDEKKTDSQLTLQNSREALDRVSLNSFDSESSAAFSSEQSEQIRGRLAADFARSGTSHDSSEDDSLISELESELESQFGASESEMNLEHWTSNRATISHPGKRHGNEGGTMSSKHYEIQIEDLHKTIKQLQKETSELRDNLTTTETEFRKVLATTRAESSSKIDKLTKDFESAKREKEAMVVRYAQSEREVIMLKKARDDMERKLRDCNKERESLNGKLRVLHIDRVRACSSLDSKMAELAMLQKEHEKSKEELNGRDIKIKWAQNKLVAEMDAHKETQTKLEQTMKRLKETKEEAEQIRKDCQEMIRRYQEAEEIKSVSLDLQLRQKLSELEVQKQEKSDQEEVYEMIRSELESLKKKHKLSINENNSLTVKIHALEKERLEYEQTVSKLKDVQNTLRQEIVDLNSTLSEMENLQMQLNREKEKVAAAQREAERIRQSHVELQCDMEACHLKEGELLEFTERLTAKSVHLQSEHSLLEIKAQNLEEELTRLNKKLDEMEELNSQQKTFLEEERHHRKEETQILARKLAEKTKAMDQVTTKLEESENENRVMKRRHIASIKELSRELHHTKRRLDNFETTHMVGCDANSIGSRTSSTGSLDKMNNHCVNGPSAPPCVTFTNHRRSVSSVSVQTKEQEHDNGPTGSNSPAVDRQMLIERIVRIQRSMARKNDKIEFMEEHIKQLLAEIKKKSRIIQNYILREEAGALTPSTMDQNKVDLSKKGGIMASVYSSQCSDSHLTLELSLEINQKLQAVLEDTLLKNITLKENINTLGEEIARITKDHRELLNQSQRHRSIK